MTTIPQLADALHTLFNDTAEGLAARTGFVRRKRKLTGPTFAKVAVFGWLADPDAGTAELARTAAALGTPVTPRALDRRFTERAADFLRALLAEAAGRLIAAGPAPVAILRRFAAVVVLDSTTVALPDALAGTWRGCGGSTAHGTAAAVKPTVGLDLRSGRLYGPEPHDGKSGDLSAATAAAELPAGSLRIADLNYFTLGGFARLAAAGSYWLSRLKPGTVVAGGRGRRLDVPAELRAAGDRDVDRDVVLGAEARVACRLIARRLPPSVAEARRRRLREKAAARGTAASAAALALCDWTVLVTNAPRPLLGVAEASGLYRARWQIELLFRLWKGHGGLESWGDGDPWRALCTVYAKLLAMVVQHWLILKGCWSDPHRSAERAARRVRPLALAVAVGLRGIGDTIRALDVVLGCLSSGCRIDTRRSRPSTSRLLACLGQGP